MFGRLLWETLYLSNASDYTECFKIESSCYMASFHICIYGLIEKIHPLTFYHQLFKAELIQTERRRVFNAVNKPPRPPFSGSIHRAIINNKRQASIFNRREPKQAAGSHKPWARTVRSNGGGGPGCMAKVTRPGLAGRASKHVKS